MLAHPVTRRVFAEELVRLRRADEQQRWVASQRAGRIDPNPHQIDAVIFALQRLPQGGCILADEVGLGKTIEAGLVIAQRRAEGSGRILLVTPKPLVGQWRHELYALFGIEAREVTGSDARFDDPAVYLVGREWAGGEVGSELLRAAARFDLVVIDEAHEIFAGIYKRFDRHGQVKDASKQATLAHRVRRAIAGSPVLLLTATPIQNTLTELWGLVQYVEPTGALLGDLGTFRAIFCAGDDRTLRAGQDDELRRRIGAVCQRTLRRQAQEFMKQPFVQRRAKLFGYTMTSAERSLYDDVTAYLLDPRSCAFRGGHRRLLIIGFHRRMASSQRALAASLENVALRLEGQLRGVFGDGDTVDMFAHDLEQSEVEPTDVDEGPPPEAVRIAAELARVRDFIARAHAIGIDSKARQLIRAVRLVQERFAAGEGSGKIVIFTESLATQAYLREVLLAEGVVGDGEITLFAGTNESPRAREALARWQQEVGERLPPHGRPSAQVAMRLALVHEFHSRAKVFIATEAGAKGLNLQFCDTVVNYDLPWNPQRIEQRIGRCHRYGQRHDVTVVNLLATDNEAESLVFDILSRKLDLFGTVLDASDVILHEPGARAPETLASVVGAELESHLRRIYEHARTIDELSAELQALRDRVGEARDSFEATYKRTAGLIESRFDESVRHAFRTIERDLAGGLASFDRALEQVVLRWLAAIGAPARVIEAGTRRRIVIEPHPALPPELRQGGTLVVGEPDPEGGDALHLGHAVVHAALAEARAATASGRHRVALRERPAELSGPLQGRLVLLRLEQQGFEPVVELLPIAVAAPSGAPLPPEQVRALLAAALHDSDDAVPPVDPRDLEDAIDTAVFLATAAIESHERRHFEDVVARIDRCIEDRVVVAQRRRTELREQLALAQRRRDAATGPDARARAERAVVEQEQELERLERSIERLAARDDEDWVSWMHQAHQRRYTAARVERILEVEFTVP
ncbi:MAG: SNF2-related protein [Nannocystaceae bacterium]